MLRLIGLLLVLVCCGALLPGAASAQSRLPSQIGPVALSGAVGFTAQTYGTSGVASRRDPFLAEAFVNFSASAYRFSYGIDAVLSTRESRFDRSFNRAGLNVSYRWIKVEGGDIAPRYADYGLRGVTFFGAGLELTPGPLVLSITGGRVREASDPAERDPFQQAAYERRLFAAKLGVGDDNRSHFHLTAFYATDDTTSLPPTEGLAPVQNVSLSPSLGLHLFGGKTRFKAVGTVSAFTRDSREDSDFDLESSGVPAWALDLFTPNLTTQVDYAVKVDGQTAIAPVTLRGSFEQVGSGFESLGLAATRRDFQRVRGQFQTTLFSRRLRVGVRGERFRNNLLGLLAATRQRLQLGLNAQVQVTEQLGVSAGYTSLGNRTTISGSEAGRGDRNQRVHTLLFSPSLTLRRGDVTHNANVSTTYQRSDDPSADGLLAVSSRYASTNVSSSYALGFASGLALTTSANLLVTDAEQSLTQAFSANLGASRGFFQRVLTLSIGTAYSLSINEVDQPGLGGIQRTRVSRITATGSARYAVPFGGTLSLTSRVLSATPDQQASYQEGSAVLRYTRRL